MSIELNNNLSNHELYGLLRFKTRFFIIVLLMFAISFQLTMVNNTWIGYIIICCSIIELLYVVLTVTNLIQDFLIYKNIIKIRPKKIVLNKDYIVFFYHSITLRISANNLRNAKTWTLCINNNYIMLCCNNIQIVTKNNLNFDEITKLKEIIKHYKCTSNDPRYNEDYNSTCQYSIQKIKPIIFKIFISKIKENRSIFIFFSLIPVLLLINVFLQSMILLYFCILSILTILLYCIISLVYTNNNYDKAYKLISEHKISFNDNCYIISKNNKILSCKDLSSILTIKEYKEYYLINTIEESFVLSASDFKNIQNDFPLLISKLVE